MKWKSELMARDSCGYGKFFDGNSSGQLLAYDLIMQEIKGICSSGWTFRHYTKLFLTWRPKFHRRVEAIIRAINKLSQ
jgi:hypothetical protein